jgi:hypothetical protein
VVLDLKNVAANAAKYGSVGVVVERPSLVAIKKLHNGSYAFASQKSCSFVYRLYSLAIKPSMPLIFFGSWRFYHMSCGAKSQKKNDFSHNCSLCKIFIAVAQGVLCMQAPAVRRARRWGVSLCLLSFCRASWRLSPHVLAVLSWVVGLWARRWHLSSWVVLPAAPSFK